MKRFHWRTLGLCAVGLAASVACSSPSLSDGELNAVMTRVSSAQDFSGYKTYARGLEVIELCDVAPSSGKLDPDGIGEIPSSAGGAGGAGGAGNSGGRDGLVIDSVCYAMDHGADDAIWAAVDANMQARNFKKVELDEAPDVVVLAAHVSRSTWYYAPTYVWCDPAFGYQCWYPKETLHYEFAAGSVSLLMIDPAVSGYDDLRSIWFASMSGVYNQTVTVFEQNVTNSINLAFAQSTAIKAGAQ